MSKKHMVVRVNSPSTPSIVVIFPAPDTDVQAMREAVDDFVNGCGEAARLRATLAEVASAVDSPSVLRKAIDELRGQR